MRNNWTVGKEKNTTGRNGIDDKASGQGHMMVDFVLFHVGQSV